MKTFHSTACLRSISRSATWRRTLERSVVAAGVSAFLASACTGDDADGNEATSASAATGDGATSSGTTGSGGSTGSTTGSSSGSTASGAGGSSAAGTGGATSSGAGGDPSDNGAGGEGPGASGPSLCGDSDFLFCEDFEDGIDSDWETILNGGTLEVDSTRAARGSSSVRAHMPLTNGEAVLIQESIFPVEMNTFYVRAFIYTEGPLPALHIDLLQARGNSDLPSVTIAMGDEAQSGTFEPLYHGTEPGQSDVILSPQNPPVLPTGRWACFEWGLHGDTNEIFAYLDDEELTEIRVSASENWAAPTYASLKIGLVVIHEEEVELDFWFDEIAFSTSRIGCDR